MDANNPAAHGKEMRLLSLIIIANAISASISIASIVLSLLNR